MNLGLAGIKILAGNSNLALAQKIANELNVPIAKCDVTHFSDGEINVNIMETGLILNNGYLVNSVEHVLDAIDVILNEHL